MASERINVTEIEVGKDSLPTFGHWVSGFCFVHGPSERAACGVKLMRRKTAEQ